MAEKLIGREDQVSELREYAASPRSEFIAVYGRRRVGKTFLVRKTFDDKFAFYITGMHGASKLEQLSNFALTLQRYTGSEKTEVPSNWVFAFDALAKYLENAGEGKKILFFDELPWMETQKSGFISALENFWNSWAVLRNDILLIVCGSATSWIINNIIRNRGGLHNRVTHQMRVEPFHLKECEQYFKAFGFRMSRMQIAEAYMVMGGIPYYFSLMNPKKSLTQNIDALFFNSGSTLYDEFNNLYRSLFKNYRLYIKIVESLATKGYGLTRKELINRTGLPDNGNLSIMLEELELCGLIRSYQPYEKSNVTATLGRRAKNGTIYQLVDFYTIFYFKFLKDRPQEENTWSFYYNDPKLNAWRGITFEKLCFYHYRQIKETLGISGISTRLYSWRSSEKNPGAQIDMIIDRKDDAINICEMKFSRREFKIDKKYFENLENKIETFTEETGTSKNIIMTLVTTQGLGLNQYSDIIQSQITLDNLFR